MLIWPIFFFLRPSSLNRIPLCFLGSTTRTTTSSPMSRQVDQTWIMKRGHSWHYFGIGLILFDIRNHTYYTWLVVWNMTFVTFQSVGNNHPSWLIFFRGVETTNQYILQNSVILMDFPVSVQHYCTQMRPWFQWCSHIFFDSAMRFFCNAELGLSATRVASNSLVNIG